MKSGRWITLKTGLVLTGVAMLVLPVLGACRVGYPFRGPGYDPSRGVTHPGAEEQVFVIITQGDIASGRNADFARELRAVLDTMHEHDGLVGYSVRRELFGSRVWTMSAWIDRDCMERFVRSPQHRRAVADGGIRPSSFVSATTEVLASGIPLSWPDAERLLEYRAPE